MQADRQPRARRQRSKRVEQRGSACGVEPRVGHALTCGARATTWALSAAQQCADELRLGVGRFGRQITVGALDQLGRRVGIEGQQQRKAVESLVVLVDERGSVERYSVGSLHQT